MSALLAAVSAVGVGIASALVPVVNAEAYALLAAARSAPLTSAVAVLALAVGQTLGKVALFESARAGGARLHLLQRLHRPRRSRHRAQPHSAGAARAARWAQRSAQWMRSARLGPPVVFAAATIGVPPLAIVSIAAGAAGQRRSLFALLCLLGRTLRFGAVVVTTVWVTT